MTQRNNMTSAELMEYYAETDHQLEKISVERETLAVSCDFIELTASSFNSCRFIESRFENSYFKAVEFIGCDLSAVRFSDSVFDTVKFIRCRLAGTVFSKSRFSSCVFEECTGKYTVYADTEFKDSIFSNCSMPEITLTGAELGVRVFMKDNNFSRGDFSHISFKALDLSSCDISGARLSLGKLKGLSINYEQALMITEMLGINII